MCSVKGLTKAKAPQRPFFCTKNHRMTEKCFAKLILKIDGEFVPVLFCQAKKCRDLNKGEGVSTNKVHCILNVLI